MEARDLSDEKMAGRIGVARETVTRWRKQQHRLNPNKIAAIAEALDLNPADLWQPPQPNRPSVDALMRDAPDELVKQAAEMAAILLRR